MRTKLGLWVSPTVGDRAARHTVRRRGAGGVPAESAAAAAVPGLGARPASPGRRHRGLRQPPPRERRAPGPRGPGTVPRPPQTPQLGSPPSWGVHTGGGLRGGALGWDTGSAPTAGTFQPPAEVRGGKNHPVVLLGRARGRHGLGGWHWGQGQGERDKGWGQGTKS